jgi:ribosomal-protein-alanine N-acetyltransferase
MIRSATPDDIPFMMHLEQACPTAAHWSEQQYVQLFQAKASGPERLVLAIKGMPDAAADEEGSSDQAEILRGFLVARRVASEWELENVVIASKARRKGFGRRLLEALMAHAVETHSDSVFLEVRESNGGARALYHRAGFVEIGRRKLYYANPAEDAILYCLRLSSRPG